MQYSPLRDHWPAARAHDLLFSEKDARFVASLDSYGENKEKRHDQSAKVIYSTTTYSCYALFDLHLIKVNQAKQFEKPM